MNNTKNKHHILYVEDSIVNAALFQEYIQSVDDVDLEVATTGEEGLEMVKANRPDMILMDINLPGMNGIDTMQAIRELGTEFETFPIIAVSADSISNEIKRALNAGFDAYLTKPIFFDKLKELLNEHLGLN